MLDAGIIITGLVIAVVLVCLLVKVNKLSKKIDKLSRPVVNIDEEAAMLIAEKLASIPISKTNKYDAISAVVNNADKFESVFAAEGIIKSIMEN